MPTDFVVRHAAIESVWPPVGPRKCPLNGVRGRDRAAKGPKASPALDLNTTVEGRWFGGPVSRHFTKVFRYLLSRAHVEAERCALYATDNQESEPRGIKKSPFSLCDCLCSGILPLERADSARTKLWCKLSGGLHHAEDSNCAGCILGDAERCRRCRPASQGAAASGASSGWQVAGRQGSDWQISTSSARRDQGLTVCVLDARKIERSGCAFHYHTYAPLRRGISFDWNREAFLLTGIAMWRRRAGHAVFGAFDPLNDWRSGHQGLWPLR